MSDPYRTPGKQAPQLTLAEQMRKRTETVGADQRKRDVESIWKDALPQIQRCADTGYGVCKIKVPESLINDVAQHAKDNGFSVDVGSSYGYTTYLIVAW